MSAACRCLRLRSCMEASASWGTNRVGKVPQPKQLQLQLLSMGRIPEGGSCSPSNGPCIRRQAAMQT